MTNYYYYYAPAAFTWLAMILPFQLGLLPLYQMMRDLDLLGTPFSVILFYCGYQLPFTIFLYAGYLRALPRAYDEAARIDGATDLQVFRHVIFPALTPALLTGVALALARALGEYGSVIFIAGNMPFRTEIAPVLIVARLEEFAYSEATALAAVLLVFSFLLLGVINLLQRWSKAYGS